jgi:hypothetical protein
LASAIATAVALSLTLGSILAPAIVTPAIFISLVQLLAADYNEHGRDVIEQVRQNYPVQYLRLIVSVLPKRRETRPAEPPAEKLTNEEIARLIPETKQLLARVEAGIDEGEH